MPREFKAPASMCLYDTILLTCSEPFALFAAMSSTFNFLFKVLFTFPSWYLFTISLIGIIELKVSFTTFFALNFQGARFLEAYHTQKITHDNQDVHLHCCFLPKDLHVHFPW